MQLSVVLPTFRLRQRISVSLRALAAQTLDPARFEVIVVDDGSGDGTAELVERWHPPFSRHLLRNPTNSGRSVTRNRGAAAASGDALVFLDGDMIPAPWLLQTYSDHFERHPATGDPYVPRELGLEHFSGLERALGDAERRAECLRLATAWRRARQPLSTLAYRFGAALNPPFPLEPRK